MEKRSNALSIVLGLMCAGLVAYIAFDKPLNSNQTGNKDAATNQQHALSASHSKTSGAEMEAMAEGNATKAFCAMPPSMLIDLIRNYKTQVWSKTSNTGSKQYDARFMEVSIDQLQNFIDVAKSSAVADGVNLTSVRLYYINYGGTKKTEAELMENHDGNVFHDFAGCHSIAFVPVVGADAHDPNRKDYFMKGQNFEQPCDYNTLRSFDNQNFTNDPQNGLTMIPNYDCNTPSVLMNHNELCPPMTGCAVNTLLSAADHD